MTERAKVAPGTQRAIGRTQLSVGLAALVVLVGGVGLVVYGPGQMPGTKASATAGLEAGLAAVEADITQRFPEMQQIDPGQLQGWMGMANKRDETVLLDIRDAAEFRVSHLSGAVRLDQIASSDPLPRALDGVDLQGKTIVVYCSVGERSAWFVRRAEAQLRERGAATIVGLRGGVFAWHNERRTLRNAGGATDYVHPYNSSWGRYLSRRDLIRYQP